MSLPFRDPLAALPAALPPLTEDRNADGKSLVNPPRKEGEPLSEWYERYPEELDESNNAYDFHIYYNAGVPVELEHARKLHQRVRYEFPELRVYKFWEQPLPLTFPWIAVNTFTPAQFGALFGFLTAYRGNLSVLIHPNTDDEFLDHTAKATWMGERIPLITSILRPDQPRFSGGGAALKAQANAA
ncbi:SPOSA6832_01562, partial [Sporobolomyces salmonicolor]